MRIVSLSPFITETLIHLGVGDRITGYCGENVLFDAQAVRGATDLSLGSESAPGASPSYRLRCLSEVRLDWGTLSKLKPDLIFASLPDRLKGQEHEISQELKELVGEQARLLCFNPRTLNEIYDFNETLGRVVGASAAGLSLSHRLKAQVMDLADNFYERLRNKKVTFLSGTADNPTVAGYWIADLLTTISAKPQVSLEKRGDEKISWSDIVQFSPDVMVIAQKGASLAQSINSFQFYEKLAQWEKIAAVKRGAVFFSDGDRHFYSPGPSLIESATILISCVAGLDSGYIAPRDSFYRLRWLEMMRHKI
jgi:ABC-type Fe3+-hydroxamate transport system substrate-binding protein